MGIRMVDSDVTWLGSLVWYSISDHQPVEAAQLLAWADELGLELVSRPTPRTADAFKTSTSAAGGRWTEAPGVVAELSFRQIRSTDDVVIRHLFKTVVDERQARSSQEKVAEVKFHRPTRTTTGRRQGSEQITHRIAPGLDERTQQEVQAVLDVVYAQYGERIAYLNEGTLRKSIRDLIDVAMMGLPLRRSGVYFVLPEHQPMLAQLAALVAKLGPGCSLHSVPLVDDAVQRRLLSDALASECVELAGTISAAAQAGSIVGRPRVVLSARLAAQREKVAVLGARFDVVSLVSRAALAEAGEALEVSDPAYGRRMARELAVG